MRKIVFGYVLFFAAMFALFFGNRLYILRGTDAYKYHGADGNARIAQVNGEQFEVYDGHGNWSAIFITGVNVGATKPGYFPGEFGITHDDYLRWFTYIGELGVNTIRVYTVQMPQFYHALAQYNGNAPRPLYLIHGVYINEADIAAYSDAYQDGKIISDFKADICNVIDVIHGNATLERTRGNAGGVYTADVSQYVIGLIPGIEWETGFVLQTNLSNPDKTSFDGAYVYTQDATAFERFLAESIDTAIAYETKQYGEQRPIAICNWVTTDPLKHPGEPHPQVEDAVSVDPEHIRAKETFVPGFFASYHIFPYYPDFFGYEKKYLADGKQNTYRAYLEELSAYHTMPVLVSEVGIPSSRGIGHKNPVSGFNQGHVSEREQGRVLTALVDDIYTEGMMGAVLFSWQDEWFKNTWNTMQLDMEERRPFWMDFQTNEQSFGLLAFDPGGRESVCYVDGDISEWSGADVVAEGGGYRLSMKSDAQFLYLMAQVRDFDSETLYIPLDTIPEQGNTEYNAKRIGEGIDFLLVLSGADNSAVLVDAYYDPTYYTYGVQTPIMERNRLFEQRGCNLFLPVTQMLSRGMYLPEWGKTLPYETFETGKLRYGVANPSAADFDSIADFYHQDGNVEIRLPWLVLNVADPSSGKILDDFYANNGIVTRDAVPLRVSILGISGATTWGEYAWPRWEAPAYHERLKDSYYILQDYFAELDAGYAIQRTPFELLWFQWNQTAFSRMAYWFPIQPVLNYTVAFLLSIILYFFLVLLYLHTMSNLRERKQRRLRGVLDGAVSCVMAGDMDGAAQTVRKLRLTSAHKLPVLSDAFGAYRPEQSDALRRVLAETGYADFVTRQLCRKDESYLIELMRLAVCLELGEIAPRIVQLLRAHRENIDMQYQGFMALSQLGAQAEILEICKDEGFTHTLSFRSLQEIFKAYTGDKAVLFETLLHAPDQFIVRICIKRIGVERMQGFGAALRRFLDSADPNLVMDAARALGQLRNSDSAPKLVALMSHEKWEVRCISTEAVASIDRDGHEHALAQALRDQEWQVRFNAANALKQARNLTMIRAEIIASRDQFALEILDYCTREAGLMREGGE